MMLKRLVGRLRPLARVEEVRIHRRVNHPGLARVQPVAVRLGLNGLRNAMYRGGFLKREV